MADEMLEELSEQVCLGLCMAPSSADIDPTYHCGWSVLARGLAASLGCEGRRRAASNSSSPSWVIEERDAWLAIEELRITGRRLRADVEWAFDIRGYL